MACSRITPVPHRDMVLICSNVVHKPHAKPNNPPSISKDSAIYTKRVIYLRHRKPALIYKGLSFSWLIPSPRDKSKEMAITSDFHSHVVRSSAREMVQK